MRRNHPLSAPSAPLRLSSGVLCFASMRHARWLAVCVALGVATVSPWATPTADASVSIAIPFDALVHASSAVVVATAVEQRSVWEGTRIQTYSRVHVDSFVAGELAQDGEAWVRTMGGTVGRVGQIVDGEPVFTVGRPSLVFLHRVAGDPTGVFLVTARAQGQFGLYADEQNRLRVRRSSAVGALVPPLGAGGIPPGALAGDVIHGRVVEDVTRDIATAWSRAHAP
jgi:hypothetical protein